jgi:hypothetical protein
MSAGFAVFGSAGDSPSGPEGPRSAREAVSGPVRDRPTFIGVGMEAAKRVRLYLYGKLVRAPFS